MKLFNKNRTQVSNDATAQHIANTIISKQVKLAEYLNKKASRFSVKNLRLWFIGFCLAFGGYSMYLIIGAFN